MRHRGKLLQKKCRPLLCPAGRIQTFSSRRHRRLSLCRLNPEEKEEARPSEKKETEEEAEEKEEARPSEKKRRVRRRRRKRRFDARRQKERKVKTNPDARGQDR